MKRRKENLGRLPTEGTNFSSADLDCKPSLEIARIINREDGKVAGAVRRALPQIAQAIDWIAEGIRKRGRLIYVGTGTSGRLGALDASECPPTFGVDPKLVQFVIAGGTRALHTAVEASEDSRSLGSREMAKRKISKNDIVVGIAASGRTPFTIAALEYARRRGAKTIAVTCNPHSALERVADLTVLVEVGPEVIAGSSRMKAGTAEKMVLNMLSSGAMTRLGYVYGNLMVNLHRKNSKLLDRGITILERASGLSRPAAEKALKSAGNSVPVALVMVRTAVDRQTAQRALKSSHGHVRQAIERASLNSSLNRQKGGRT
ncbi:MAG TPA: N-acetylmuramic acid 6-phosphate etherase [Terriglobales bacterium]|nr:N-acetylmuramic acid 6-phosphate etherase [Terriglobales bacterium]